MMSIEQRLAAVEIRLTAQQEGMAVMSTHGRETETDLLGTIRALDERMERRFDAVDRRFDALDRRFVTLIAMQFTTLLALLGAAIGFATGGL